MTKDEIHDLNLLAWPAMRHALGATTHVVEDVCFVLKQRAHELRPDIRNQMIHDISRAIKNNESGAQYDTVQWKEVLKKLRSLPCPFEYEVNK